MTGGPAFALRGLTKRFGRVTAVDGVSVEVAPGEVVAVLGPNGAGKSTTVDMLLGLTEPDAGEITVAGGTPREAVDRGVVGAMMQNGALLPDAGVRAAVSGRVLKAVVPGATEADLAQLPGVTSVQLRAGRAEVACADSDAAIRALLVKYPRAADIEITALGLEEAFLALTAEEAAV